jgi:DNA-binding GntR family transcriptional regulator
MLYIGCMPIPTDSVATSRVLLRDSAYEQLCAAILDRTLRPGERLYDSELTAWLGASRTPVREAIWKVAGLGLIEIATNRYTRVANLSAAEFSETAWFLQHLHRVALDHLATSPRSARVAARAAAADVLPRLRQRDLAAYLAASEAFSDLITAQGNARMVAADADARMRVRFHAAAPDVAIDWTTTTAYAEELANA